MEIEINILRPVNPTGKSFITNVYGAIITKDKELIDKYKSEISRNVQKLGYKIEEIIGNGKLISGTFVILIDDDTKKPKKIYVKNIKVWSVEKEINNSVGVDIS